MKKRFLSVLLLLTLCLSLLPFAAWAEEAAPAAGVEEQGTVTGEAIPGGSGSQSSAETETDAEAENDTGLCPHHTEHDEACGYVAAVEGVPCAHKHTEDCGKEAEDCAHEHDEACGYVAAVEGVPCGFVCELCAPEEDDAPQTTAGDTSVPAADTYRFSYNLGNGEYVSGQSGTCVDNVPAGDKYILRNAEGAAKNVNSKFQAPAEGMELLGWSLKDTSGVSEDFYAWIDYYIYYSTDNSGKVKQVEAKGAYKDPTLENVESGMELYAVYGYPYVHGYTLTIKNANFSKETTDNGKELKEYGLTSAGSPKYFVADSGYTNTTHDLTILAPNPISSSGEIFLGWYDKNASTDPDTFSNNGDTVSMTFTGNIYSHDAMWTTPSNLEDATKIYDANSLYMLAEGLTLTVNNLGDGGNKSGADRIEAFHDAMNIQFVLTVKDKDGKIATAIDGTPLENLIIESIETYDKSAGTYGTITYGISFADAKDASGKTVDIGQLTVGEYTYSLTPIIINSYRDNEKKTLDAIQHKLTINPVDLAIEGKTTVYAMPGETVTVTFGDNGTAVTAANLQGKDQLSYSATVTVTAPASGQVTKTFTGADTKATVEITNNDYPTLVDRINNYKITENLSVTVIVIDPTPTTLTVPLTKAMKDGSDELPAAETFTFNATRQDSNNTVTSTVANNKITLSGSTKSATTNLALSLKTASQTRQTVKFELSEAKGSTAGMTYDDSKYTLSVLVYNDGTGQTVIDSWKLEKGSTSNAGTAATTDGVTFTNSYSKSNVPKTGDETNMALWFGLMGLSLAGIAAILPFRKKIKLFNAADRRMK